MSETLWTLTPQQVIDSPEVTLLIFHNNYPEGKQGGVEILQHSERVATNGDVRLETAPGQWSPLPKITSRSVDSVTGQVSVQLEYPQTAITYSVRAWAEGESIRVSVDLDQPLPEEWAGRAGFNLELLPSALFGKSYRMDGQFGSFPRQANGPVDSPAVDSQHLLPLARGQTLMAAPEDPYHRLKIEALRGELMLLDGRDAAHNGWFVVRSLMPGGTTQGAVEWRITPNRVKGWQRAPVILFSQVGYHPDQEKQALIELDPHAASLDEAVLLRVQDDGELLPVLTAKPEAPQRWLRYQYARFDFSQVREPGMYILRCQGQSTPPFAISPQVYQTGVWQPTLETFLPVQMCHVRVEDLYRVWHGACHLDDAIQAPINHEHFDGYHQYGETETAYQPFEHIPGLDRGGWHDAGDYDLATGSQAATTYNLALAWEAFRPESDQTTVRRGERLVVLHQPDGVPDIIQQITHGVECLLAGYHTTDHSIAGIIESTIKQYVHLGDAATMTDNRIFDPSLPADQVAGERAGARDDRWAFTNHDTALEYQVAAALAAAGRALKGYEDALAGECLETAQRIWQSEHSHEPVLQPAAYIPRHPGATEILAAVELLITTGEDPYRQRLAEMSASIAEHFDHLGWAAARVRSLVPDAAFQQALRQGAEAYQNQLSKDESASPFRLPFGPGWLRANQPGHDPFASDYHPPIWGVGWTLQHFAVQHYYLVKAFPDLFDRESLLRVLNYVLGCHPANNLSLVSGVGAQSLTIAYGTNRAEWSYTPGGIASGPSLLRPDILELMDPWPYLWQQKEYVIGGAATYIFLVLAADQLLNG